MSSADLITARSLLDGGAKRSCAPISGYVGAN